MRPGEDAARSSIHSDYILLQPGALPGAGPIAVNVWPSPLPDRLVVMGFKKLVVEVGASSGKSEYQVQKTCKLAKGSHTLPDPNEWINTQGGCDEILLRVCLIKVQWQA